MSKIVGFINGSELNGKKLSVNIPPFTTILNNLMLSIANHRDTPFCCWVNCRIYINEIY